MKRIIIFLIIMVLSANLYAAKKTILVIESYHSTYSWDKSYLRGIKSIVKKQYNIKTFEMNTKRVPKNQYQKMADKAWKNYQKVKPDLVILGDDNALKFLGKKFAKTDTPTIYLGINNNPRAYIKGGHKNITGILERPVLKRSIVYINTVLKGNVKKVLVLFDSGTTSNVAMKNAFKGKKNMKLKGISADLKLIGKWNVWKNTVKNAKKNGYDAIVVGLYHTIVDGKGKNVKASKVLNWTSKNTKIPPFAFWDFAVGKNKTIGGFVLFGKAQGEMAGKMALQILAGEKKPYQIPIITPQRGILYYSKQQLKKYKITLPAEIKKNATLID